MEITQTAKEMVKNHAERINTRYALWKEAGYSEHTGSYLHYRMAVRELDYKLRIVEMFTGWPHIIVTMCGKTIVTLNGEVIASSGGN